MSCRKIAGGGGKGKNYPRWTAPINASRTMAGRPVNSSGDQLKSTNCLSQLRVAFIVLKLL
jgi:hypothetical protein